LAVSSFSVLFASAGEKVKQVDARYVCMITKKHFTSEQMAVNVEGRTYYACCDMCKTELRDEPSSRTDIDPVSGNKVDKASAVVGVDNAGNVYFFENVENLTQFRVPSKK
jgi:YHS domain-containing protein